MGVAVQLVDAGPGLIAAVQRQTMYADVPRVLVAGLDIVWAVVRGKGLRHGHNVALYRALGGNAVDVTCAVEVAARFDPDGEVVCTDMPTGRTAHATHAGPYARLGETHRAIAEWALANGHRLAGLSWEVYDDPVDDPEKLRTDVYMLLAQA
jgi:effector-binding domain-containing protein